MFTLDDAITIDTGLNTACAIWQGTLHPKIEVITCSSKHKTLYDRIYHIQANLSNILHANRNINHAFVETVALWSDSEKSLQSAKSGDLMTLCYLASACMTVLCQHGIKFEPLEARKWKGNLSKEGTAMRVKLINGCEYESDHITDAVAMGLSRDHDLWSLRHLRKYRKSR